MKSLETWFEEYAVCHQNETNQMIHFICVPVIMFASLGMIWTIPTLEMNGAVLNWVYPVIGCITGFYAALSFKYAAVMLVFQVACVAAFQVIQVTGFSVLWTCLALFVVAWGGQFYGHKVEGKKPSFFEDLTYLFIGPLWVLGKVAFGVCKKTAS